LNETILDTNISGEVLNISVINISMRTKYPESWNDLIIKFNKTNKLRVEGDQIIINITGSSKKYLVYPNQNTYKDSINSGMLMFTSNYKTLNSVINQNGGTTNNYGDSLGTDI